VRGLLAAVVTVAAVVAATAPVAGATGECQGIQKCISVPGPWVVVQAHGTAQYLLTCPNGVVAGTDAQVTSRDVHVSFDARLGAPVAPGVSTTKYAYFTAVSTSSKPQEFQPLLGCVPTQGGGGRSTVSARATPPGPALEYRTRIVVIGPSELKSARVSCLSAETLVGAWHAIAFRTKKPPSLAHVDLVHASHAVVKKTAVVTATSTDALSVDAHAVVQVGARCAP
jgi:hypothetical protein